VMRVVELMLCTEKRMRLEWLDYIIRP
jgi:hypothetical protein